jgi:hypothetical protein
MCFILTASAARWALLIFDHPTPQDLVEYLNGRLIAAEPERGGEVPTTAVGLQAGRRIIERTLLIAISTPAAGAPPHRDTDRQQV